MTLSKTHKKELERLKSQKRLKDILDYDLRPELAAFVEDFYFKVNPYSPNTTERHTPLLNVLVADLPYIDHILETLGWSWERIQELDDFVDGIHLSLVRRLVQAGENPNVRTVALTPLILAIEKNNEDLMELLLNSGADPNFGSIVSTPLMTAISRYNPLMVEQLLVAKADPNHEVEGITPLIRAIQVGRKHYVKLLIEAGADINDNRLLIEAIKARYYELTEMLLKTQFTNDMRRTALDFAMATADSFYPPIDGLRIYSMLLSSGAEIQNPHKLFQIILRYDQGRSEVLALLYALHENLSEKSNGQPDFFRTLEQHIHNLEMVTYGDEETLTKKIDDAIKPNLPTAIVKIITGYDNSFDRFRTYGQFFQPKDIDSIIQSKESKPKPKRQCSGWCSMM